MNQYPVEFRKYNLIDIKIFTPAQVTEDDSSRGGPLLIFCTRSEIMQQIGNDRARKFAALTFWFVPTGESG